MLKQPLAVQHDVMANLHQQLATTTQQLQQLQSGKADIECWQLPM